MERRHRERGFAALVVLLLVLVITAAIGYGAAGLWLGEDSRKGPGLLPGNLRKFFAGGPTTFLLLGVDARPGEKDARTDTIIVAQLDPEKKKLVMVSVPRDTLVELPGHGREKINSANVYGGVDLVKQVVSEMLNVEIDYYIKTNFEGFKQVVDTLGGVNIEVEKRMVYRDPTDGTYINLKPGLQHLNGKEALDYVRFRHDALGDVGRTQRQQHFLKAVAEAALKPSVVTKLPQLMKDINQAVQTDMSVGEMVKYATLARDFGQLEIVSQTLPGQFYNNHGSYWKHDATIARTLIADLMNGKTYPMIVGADINEDERPKKKVSRKTQVAKARDSKSTTGSEKKTSTQPVNNNPTQTPDSNQNGSATGNGGNENLAQTPAGSINGSGSASTNNGSGTSSTSGGDTTGGTTPGGTTPVGTEPGGSGSGGTPVTSTPAPESGSQTTPPSPQG
ncbi:LCP family protein [Carboxydocella sp. ULO1]|uniref:LCP family protein n=1 Tax=Carboxydocella sp. ULO1 TaxID=1926599 RepID=UPI0009AC9902|nr:LCP family protein [Carboxydocella sp. ULO1]GAW29493.1 transcriptional regulator [Carboxydocella sp. ULO1]